MLGPNEEVKMMNDEVTTNLNDQNPLRGKCHFIFPYAPSTWSLLIYEMPEL